MMEIKESSGWRTAIKEGIFMYYSKALETISISAMGMGILIIVEFCIIQLFFTLPLNCWVKGATYLHAFMRYYISIYNVNLLNYLLFFSLGVFSLFAIFMLTIIYYIRTPNTKPRNFVVSLNKLSFLVLFIFDKGNLGFASAHLCIFYFGVPTYAKIDETGVKEEEYNTELKSQSYSDILLAISIVEVVIIILLVPLFRIFEKEMKPAHNKSQSHEKSSFGLIRFLLKIGAGFHFAFDPYYNYKVPAALFASGLTFVLIFLHIKYLPANPTKTAYFQLFFDSLLFVLGILLICAWLTDLSVDTLYMILLGGAALIPIFFFTLYKRNQAIIGQNMIITKSTSSILHTITLFLLDIKSLNKTKQYGYVMSLIKYHALNCPMEVCMTKGILKGTLEEYSQELEASIDFPTDLDKMSSPNLFAICTDLRANQKTFAISDSNILNIITSILNELEFNDPKNFQLFLYRAYFEFYLRNNIFQSLYYITISAKMKNNVQSEYFIFHLLRMLSSDLEDSYAEAKGQIVKYIETVKLEQYQKAYSNSLKTMMLCSELVANFWEVILPQHPDVKLANSLAHEIITISNEIEISKKTCLDIYAYNLHFLYKLGVFYLQILNNEFSGLIVYRKIKELTEESSVEFSSTDQLGLNSFSKILMVKVGISPENPGVIMDISYDLEQMLGYKEGRLSGKGLREILPPLISESHDIFINTFLETTRNTLMYNDQMLYYTTASGYILPLNTNLRMIPALNKTDKLIQILAFCKESLNLIDIMGATIDTKNKPIYLMTDEIGKVVAISQNCLDSLGLSLSIIRDTEFTMTELIPDLVNPLVKSNFYAEQGNLFKLDVDLLKAYLDYDLISMEGIDEADSMSDSKNQNDKIKSGLEFWGKVIQKSHFIADIQPLVINYFILVKLGDKEEKRKIKRMMGEDNEKSRRAQSVLLATPNSKTNLPVPETFMNVDDIESVFSIDEHAISSIASSLINKSLNSVRNMMMQKKDSEGLDESIKKHNKFGKFILFSLIFIWLSSLAGTLLYLKLVKNHEFSFDMMKATGNAFGKLSDYNFNLLNLLQTTIYARSESQNIKSNINLLTQMSLVYHTEISEKLHKEMDYIYQKRGDFPEEVDEKWNQIVEIIKIDIYQKPVIVALELRLAISQYLAKANEVYFLTTTEAEKLAVSCPLGTDCIYYNKIYKYLQYAGFEAFRQPMEELFEYTVDFFVDYLQQDKFYYLLLVITLLIFVILNCIFVLVKATQVLRAKSIVFAGFGLIEDHELRNLLNNCYEFHVQNIWLSMHSNNVEYLMKLCNLIIEDEKPFKEQENEENENIEDITNLKIVNEGGSDNNLKEFDIKIKDKLEDKMLNHDREIEKIVSLDGQIPTSDHKIEKSSLKKFDHSMIKKIFCPVIISSFFFLIILGLDLSYSINFNADYELIAKELKYIIKRQTSLAFGFQCIVSDIGKVKLKYILNPNQPYYFQYYYSEQEAAETEIARLDKEMPKFFNKLSNAIDNLNSEQFCTELDAIMVSNSNNICRMLWGDLHRKGLRNLIFKFLSELNQFKINIQQIFDLNVAPEILNMNLIMTQIQFMEKNLPYILFVIGPAVSYLGDIYFEEAGDYISNMKNIKLYIFFGFSFSLILAYFFCFKLVNKALRTEITTSQQIQNIIPVNLISKTLNFVQKLILYIYIGIYVLSLMDLALYSQWILVILLNLSQ